MYRNKYRWKCLDKVLLGASTNDHIQKGKVGAKKVLNE